MKTVIRTLIALVCLSLLLTCLVGCNNTPLHVFKFNTPDNFDTLSVEEQLDWARENGYLVISHFEEKIVIENGVINTVESTTVVENEEKLNSFLENKREEKELLFIMCREYQGVLECSLGGLYFDGRKYQETKGLPTSTKEETASNKYDICGIEVYHGIKYLYMSNDSALTAKDMYGLTSDYDEFAKKYKLIDTLGRVNQD